VLVGWVAIVYPPLLIARKLWVHWLLFGVGFAFALIVQTIFNTAVIH